MAVIINIDEAKRDLENSELLKKIFEGYVVVIHGGQGPTEPVYYTDPTCAVCMPVVSVIGSAGKIYLTVKHQLHTGQITFVTDRNFEYMEAVMANDPDFLTWSPYFDPELNMVVLPMNTIPDTEDDDNIRCFEMLTQFVKTYQADIRIPDEDKPAIIKAATAPYLGSVTYI